MIEYKKYCPECGKEQVYKTKYLLQRAVEKNTKCKVCSNIGENNPMFGKQQTEEAKRKISENHVGMLGKHHTEENKRKLLSYNIGRKFSDETRKKLSENNVGMKGRVHTKESLRKMRERKLGKVASEETKRKMRLAVAEHMKQKNMNPNFNPSACELIENYGKENGYNFQHALNGGEYHIDELGYWLDGYDKEKNVVIEVDEKYHQREKQKEKDLKRQQEIETLLGCTFIRLTI